MSQRRSFTLIELLVVVAIIAILASLLLPALSAARGKAKQITCLNQVKQMVMGMNAYADEYDNFLPAANYADPWGGVYHWYVSIGTYMGLAERNYPTGPTLAESIQFSTDIKPLMSFSHCPSARINSSGFQLGYYSINGFHNAGYGPANWSASYGVAFAKTQQFADPTAVAAALDSNPGLVQNNAFRWSGGNSDWYSNYHARGAVGGNVGYLDGHVALRTKYYIAYTEPVFAGIYPLGRLEKSNW